MSPSKIKTHEDFLKFCRQFTCDSCIFNNYSNVCGDSDILYANFEDHLKVIKKVLRKHNLKELLA